MPTDSGHWITLEGRHVYIRDAAGHVPRRLKPADGEARRFSKAHFERHLIDHHEATAGKGTYSAADEEAINSATAGDPFTFHKKLPTEIKDFMAGRPELRSMFKVSDDTRKSGGADAFAELGDRYLDIAEAKAGSPLRAAKKTAHASNDPEVKFLAAVHDNLPEGRFSGTTIKTQGLRVGDEFTIGGSKFRVAEDDGGFRVLEGGTDYPETPVDALDQIPIDKGSFKPGKRKRLEPAPFSADGLVVFTLASDAATPVLTLGSDLPSTIDGHPVHYRRKEVARAGHFVHRGERLPGGYMEFDIATERLDLWLDSFNRRRERGIKPYVPERHVAKQADATTNFGYVVDMQRDGDSLYGVFQLIGDDALKAAARNDVSIGVVADATDDAGGHYEEAIEHICLTANPAIPNLKPFSRLAASADRPATPVFTLAAESDWVEIGKLGKDSILVRSGAGQDVRDAAMNGHGRVFGSCGHQSGTCRCPVNHPDIRRISPKPCDSCERAGLGLSTDAAPSRGSDSMMKPELAKKVRDTLGLTADAVPDDQLIDKTAEKALSLSADNATLKTERDSLRAERDTAKADRDAKANEVLQLSGDPRIDPMSMSLITRSFKTDREAVIAAGVVSEAGMKEIDNLLFSDGKPTRTALSLSAGSTDPLYSRLCEILRKFPGIKTGNGVPRDATPAENLNLAGDKKEKTPAQVVADTVAQSMNSKYPDPSKE